MQECTQVSMDLWSKPPIEAGIIKIEDHENLALSANFNDSSVEFFLPAESVDFIDLTNLYLYVKLKVTQKDKEIEADSTVSLIPLWPHAIWKQVDLFLNNNLVTSNSNNYPYRAYIETLLSFPEGVKKNQLEALEHFKGHTIKANKNSTAVVEGFIPLHLDLAHQPRLLIPGVSLKIRLLRNSDSFIFLKTDNKEYASSISKISLFVRKVTPTPSFILQQTGLLANQNAIYPIDRTWIKTFNLNKDSQDFVINNVFLGQLPGRVILGFVDSDRFNGSDTSSPFQFDNCNVNYLSLTVNGKTVPGVPYTPDFKSEFCRREYRGLLETAQGSQADCESLGIDYSSFLNQNTLFGFTLQPAITGPNQAVPPTDTGYLNIRLRFNSKLANNYTCIVWAEFLNTIEIDASRQVYTDFAT